MSTFIAFVVIVGLARRQLGLAAKLCPRQHALEDSIANVECRARLLLPARAYGARAPFADLRGPLRKTPIFDFFAFGRRSWR